jgi:protein involved in polysaccharide export with SLBB domain
MDLVFGEFIESIPRPHPSSEIIDFVRVIPSDLVLRPGDQLRVTFYELGDLPAS